MERTKLVKPNRSIGNPSAFGDRLPDDTSAFQNNNKDSPNGHQQPSRIGDELMQLSGELDTSSSTVTTTTTTTPTTTANININSATAAEQKAAAVRRVSISRSGRYKSKNKQRARLPSSETQGEVLAEATASGPNSVPKCTDIFAQFSPQQVTVDAAKPGQSTATQFARSQSQPNEARATYNSIGNFSTSNAAELRRQNQNATPSVAPRNVVAAKMMNSPCDVDDEEPAPLHIAFESTDL